MFPVQFYYSPPLYSTDVPDDQTSLRGLAFKLYSGMLTKGKWNRVRRLLDRKPKRLLDLQSFKNPTCVVNRHYAGIQSVSIEHIQGSEGRIEDFDNSFN